MVWAALVVMADAMVALAKEDVPVALALQLPVRVAELHASVHVCDGVYAYTCPCPEHNYQPMHLQKKQLKVKG